MTTGCPDATQLQQYLNDALPPEAEATLVHHVDSCPHCRERMDRLSSDGGLSFASLRIPPTPARPAYLERLRQRVPGAARQSTWRQLAAHADTRRTLPGAGSLLTSAEGQPLRLGGYDILGELGRGGMGVVYLARDVRLGRQVALKMIRGGALDDLENQSRFLSEARAIATLQHPNIVQLLEMGTLEGRLYFALEYVPGGSLAQRLDAGPLTPAQAAACLEPLARAVEHAHQQGVVHRDLKPANVLLPGGREQESGNNTTTERNVGLTAESSLVTPKVTDFGLAKRLDAADALTQTGVIVGTPSYMAPEQATGGKTEVGPAADIYALGAILYECLTGRPPFLAASALDTLEAVQHEEPVPPRRLQRHVPRDLETICLKCLQKEPAQRYATAGALAEDLGRFLRGEPIRARPVPAPERLWRWCRRNPLATTFLATLALATLGMLGLATWAWSERNRAEEHAQRADQNARAVAAQSRLTEEKRQEADRRHQEALANLVQAKQAVDECFRLAQEHPLFQGDEQRARRGLLLERARPFYEQFARQASDTPEVLRGQADILWKLGYIYDEIGPWDKSVQAHQQALAAYQRLQAGQPQEYRWQLSLAMVWNNLGGLRHKMGQRQEALACFAQAEKWQQQVLQTYGRTLTPEQHRRLQADLAMTWHNQGVLHRDLDHPGETLDCFTRAENLQQQLVAAYPDDLSYQTSLARISKNLGTAHLDQKRFTPARDYHLRALRAWERLAAAEPQRVQYQAEIAHAWQGLANIHLQQNQARPALQALTQARQRWERVHAQEPQVINHAVQLGATCCNLGNLLNDLGDRSTAATLYNRAQLLLQNVLAREPRHHVARTFLSNVHLGQAIFLEQQRRYSALLGEWTKATDWSPAQYQARRAERLPRLRQQARAEQAGVLGLAVSLAGTGGTPAALNGHLAPWLLWVLPPDVR